MSLVVCPRCKGAKDLCVGCSGFAIDHPELFGSCGRTVPCPMCDGEGEVTPEVADTLHPRLKRMREHDKYVTELPAGWAMPADARRHHYYPSGSVLPLCRKWLYTGMRLPEWRDDDHRNCVKCRKGKAKGLTNA